MDWGSASERHDMLAYRLRTVRVGIVATVLALSILAAYPLIDPDPPIGHMAGYVGMIVGALTGVSVVSLLPWRRWLARPIGMAAMYAWSVGDIVLISVGVAVSGAGDSPLWAVYALTTVFFAASYPIAGQAALLLFTALAYTVATVAGIGPTLTVGAGLVRLGMLALVAFMSSFLSFELVRIMRDERRQRVAAEEDAAIMDAVTAGTRRLQSLDVDEVLEACLDALTTLGAEPAGIATIDLEDGTFEVVRARGLPAGMDGEVVASIGRIIEEGGVVSTAVEDVEEALPPWLDAPGHIVAAPIHVRDELRAVLGGVTGRLTDDARITEGVELLASLAGRALELVEAYEAERETVERLERLDALKHDFISNVSHELRTPLTVMRGAGEILTTRWRELDDSRRERLLDSVLDNTEALDRTITTLLDFSRLEADGLDADLEPTDVAGMTVDVVRRLEGILGDRPLTVDVPDRAWAMADPGLFERVVENLVVNAATHTPPGTAVTVSVALGDPVCVEVSDDGPGIPAEDIEHITDRFVRGGTTNTRPSRGLGLGLALSDEIARLHGAPLDVDASPAGGARFRVYLSPAPVREPAPHGAT